MSDLPITYRGAVYPWHCDHMGHMNVMLTAVHLGTVRRKSCPFPQQVVERARSMVVASPPHLGK